MAHRTWSPLLAALLVVGLVACDRSPELPPTGSIAAQPEEAAPSTDFALLEAGSEEVNGRPALKLVFSQPLVPEQDFNALIEVLDPEGAKPDGGWVLDNDARTLRFPYVRGDTTYGVELRPGIAARDGRELAAQAARKVYSGNLAPVVGFASRGSVLPARGTQGLPVIAVNVTDVDVEFFKVRDKELSRFLSSFPGAGVRSLWELDEINRYADTVYGNRFALAAGANQRQVSFLPVQTINELKEPGVYFAALKRAGSFTSEYETTHFYVSDLGLHARAGKEGVYVHAASLANGEARGGIELTLQNAKGETLAQATTDAQGDAQLPLKPKSDQVLIGRSGGEVAIVAFGQPALDLSEFEVAGRAQSAQDVFAWSGRDLFRPGETLQVSALLRDYDGRSLPASQTLYAGLRQPDGRLIATTALAAESLGYYSYQREISADAPTGRWTLEYRLDPGAAEPVGRFAFRVEEFLPERLKLVLDSPAPRLKPGEPLPLVADADYLYGAPAAGNRLKVEMLYRAAQHPVAAMKEWFFGDPTVSLPKEPEVVMDGKLGDDGVLNRDVPVLDGSEPPKAPFDAIVSASVFESGGRAVRRTLTRTVWPADALIGVRPLFDPKDGPNAYSEAAFEILRADAQGQRLAAQGIKATLVREHRDYHWNWVDGSGWNTDFTRRYETIEETTFDLDGTSPARFASRIEWGEYRLDVFDPATGLTTRYPFTAGWSWDDQNQGPDARPDKVKIAFDKDGYRAGDTATLTITPPYAGPGVLLVESDGLLYRASLAARGTTTVEVPVSERFLRHDVYVTALVFRPSDNGALAGPKRALGVAHFPLAREGRNLALQLSAPEKRAPGESIEVEITSPELAGKQAFAVVEAVDLGILSLTGYPVPDALAYFLAQRGLGVEAYDLYGRVIEPLEGTRARLRYGGDAALLAALPQARRPTAKVQTVALHHAPVAFDAQGKAKLSFTAPDFNGSLRISALAYAAESFGRASTEAIVRAPLVLEVSTPRAMATGDDAALTVDLHNLSGAAQAYTVHAKATPPLQITSKPQLVQLNDNARTTLSFPLAALAGSDVGRFTVSAESTDGTKLEREFEIAVRPAFPPERRSRARVLESAQNVKFGADMFEGLQAESGRALISVSSVPPLPFAESIDGLIDYPYGCIEQTTSRLWPLVNLDEATSRKFGLEPLPESRRKHMLDTGFARIAAMQTENGRFGFWPGAGYGDAQMTPYVADLLLTAKNNGLTIPEAVLEKALKRLEDDLLSGGDGFYSYDNSQHLRFATNAYSAYVLARANRAPLGTLRSLWDNQRKHSLTALPLLQLGIALKLQGDAARAQAAIDEALQKKNERPRYLGDYGSNLRDEALLLALLHEQDMATNATAERVLKLAQTLRQPDNARRWFSTQERLAIFRLGRQLLEESKQGLAGSFTIAGESESLNGRSLVSRQVDFRQLQQGVSLALEGDGPFWLSEDIVAHPHKAPAPRDEPIRVRRSWFRTDGTRFTGDRLTEGESLIVMLTLEAQELVPDALVVDLLPAGLEIENLALGGNEAFGELMLDGVMLSDRGYAAEIRHEEFRDDRYVAAVRLWAGAPAHLFYLARAVSPGQFVVPPPTVEDMYRPQLSGIGVAEPARIRVTPP